MDLISIARLPPTSLALLYPSASHRLSLQGNGRKQNTTEVAIMLSSARSRIAAFSALTARFAARASYSSTVPRFSENPNPANVEAQPPKPNVSASNATPIENPSATNVALQEDPEVGERYRQLQAPNRSKTWARSQQPRELAMTGPRFEQTIMGYQVCYSLFLCSWNIL